MKRAAAARVQGYQLVTVSEMMSFRDEPIKAGWEYSHLDPKKIVPVTPTARKPLSRRR